MLQRPQPDEHDAYYGLYIDQAPDGDIFEILDDELARTWQTLADISSEQEVYRYAEGKWSLREIVGHLIDTEWTFAYRGLFFARRDPSVLPGFDQDHWANTAGAHERSMADLLDTFSCARKSTIAIFRGLDDEAWMCRGVANDCEFTARTIPYILAGHEIHHRKVMVERYLGGAAS